MSENYIDLLLGSAKYKEQVEGQAEERRKHSNEGYIKYNRKAGIEKLRKRNPDAGKAHAAVKYVLKTGKLVRGSCIINDQYCYGRTEAHHWHGYAKEHWLDVVWLCKHHHELADSKK